MQVEKFIENKANSTFLFSHLFFHLLSSICFSSSQWQAVTHEDKHKLTKLEGQVCLLLPFVLFSRCPLFEFRHVISGVAVFVQPVNGRGVSQAV